MNNMFLKKKKKLKEINITEKSLIAKPDEKLNVTSIRQEI